MGAEDVNRNTIKRIKKDLVKQSEKYQPLLSKYKGPAISDQSKAIKKQSNLLEIALEQSAPKLRPNKMASQLNASKRQDSKDESQDFDLEQIMDQQQELLQKKCEEENSLERSVTAKLVGIPSKKEGMQVDTWLQELQDSVKPKH